MSNSFSPSALRILRALFYGIGLYGFLLQICQSLSLIPPQYEAAARMHITFVSQCVAAGSYGVLMVVIVWLFIVGVSKLAATSVIIDNSESFDPRLVLYSICGMVNDAVINRAQDTHLVEGALDRMSSKMASTFRLYHVDRELCLFGAMFLVAFLSKRRSRSEKVDLEGRVGEKVIVEKVGVDEKNSI